MVLAGDTPRPGHIRWHDISCDGKKIGHMTNGTWSYKLERNIGFGLVAVDCRVGDHVQVHIDGEQCDATLTTIPFELQER